MRWILVLYLVGNSPPRIETGDEYATKAECLADLAEVARTNPGTGFYRCEPKHETNHAN